jgi:glycosyltransferase involved in cell wall biosynthesis
MRIAFYAPLKSPTHAVPSGDRRVGRLMIEALERAGHVVELASTLRTYESAGDSARQASLRDQSAAAADDLIARWGGAGRDQRPDIWFTYHVYYKAPDWMGPAVAAGLGIPYAIAEASFAPKRRHGAWSLGHVAAEEAIRAASLVLCPIRDDVGCLEPLVSPPAKIRLLPPFLDPAPYQAAAGNRAAHRKTLATKFHLDPSVPWIVIAAMMRVGDKASSYYMLASTLRRLTDIPWQIVVAGDGVARGEIEAAVESAAPGRARFLGECGADDLTALYPACDLCIWPAVNEAYGMALLEAQAAGIPVVSRAIRGVPDVVCHGRTGLLAPPDDEAALAELSRQLLVDGDRRRQMGQAAAQFVGAERSVDSAATSLDQALREIRSATNRSAAAVQR